MSLYNAKSTKDREVLRISKFDDCLVHEVSYLVGPKTCDCPAFFKRSQCKHQQMRVMFRAKRATDSDLFLDFEKREWRSLEEIAVADGQMIIEQLTSAVEKVPPIGVTVVGLDDPELLHNAIADEVGEPVISGLSTAPHAPEVAADASGAPPSEAKSFLRRRL
jgi:hypothetical protein